MSDVDPDVDPEVEWVESPSGAVFATRAPGPAGERPKGFPMARDPELLYDAGRRVLTLQAGERRRKGCALAEVEYHHIGLAGLRLRQGEQIRYREALEADARPPQQLLELSIRGANDGDVQSHVLKSLPHEHDDVQK